MSGSRSSTGLCPCLSAIGKLRSPRAKTWQSSHLPVNQSLAEFTTGGHRLASPKRVIRERTQEWFGGWTTILTLAPSGTVAICLCMSPNQPTLS